MADPAGEPRGRAAGSPPASGTPDAAADALTLPARPPTRPGGDRADLPLPGQVGPYRIRREIGRGGMGVVYLAEQAALKRPVALKVMLGGAFAGADAIRRFIREAEDTARLSHPHIVSILDLGEHEGRPFFSMTYIEGRPLDELIRSGDLDFQTLAGLMAKVADAVAHAHAAGIIHRDLKPANILVDSQRDPHVTDFGLAGHVHETSSLSRTGDIMGTPHYMSPEQAAGARAMVDETSDVYSLGATLYHGLTGQAPFADTGATRTLIQVMTRDPQAPRAVNRAVPRDLECICLKAMAREKERRYAAAADFAADLRRYLRDEPVLARPVSVGYRLVKWTRQNRLAAALAVSLLLLVSAAAGWAWLEWSRQQVSWERIFLDDFNRADFGPAYQVDSGEWFLAEESLRGVGAGEVTISLVQKYPGNVRFEYEARTLPENGKHEVMAFLDGPGLDKTGYYFGFGADYGRSAIDRRQEEVRLSDSPVVEPGRWYHVTVLRQGNLLEMRVDGETVVAYTDPFPLDPSTFSRIRLGTFDGAVIIDNLRIYQERIPEVMPVTAVGDRLFEQGQFAAAERAYADVVRDHAPKPIADEALYKAGICLLQRELYAEAIDTFHQVIAAGHSTFYGQLARINVGAALRLQGRTDEARAWLEGLSAVAREPDERYRLAVEWARLADVLWQMNRRAEAQEVRRVIASHFSGLIQGEQSRLLVASNRHDPYERRRMLEEFMAHYRTADKNRANAFQYLGGCLLELGDISAALANFRRMEEEYAGRNRRFVQVGIWGQGLVLACEGRRAEAAEISRRLMKAGPDESTPVRMSLDLEAFLAWRAGDLRQAVEWMEQGMKRFPESVIPLERLELACLCLDGGDPDRGEAILAELAGLSPTWAKSVRVLLQEGSVVEYAADPTVPFELRRLVRWLVHVRRNEPVAAVRCGLHLECSPFNPLACRTILLARQYPAAARSF
ncbi:MAG: protein kinase [Acidobacteria bacterium]|nr:protein kinase [Acidobacteriota bacterium]